MSVEDFLAIEMDKIEDPQTKLVFRLLRSELLGKIIDVKSK